MRRIVRDYVVAAIHRTKPHLEQFIAGHLECPESVPLIVADRLASIREIRGVKITPRYRADFPEVDVAVAVQVSVMATTRRDAAGQGMRPFLIDVALDAVGIVAGQGYEVVPHRAWFTAWWSDNGFQTASSSQPPRRLRTGLAQRTATSCPNKQERAGQDLCPLRSVRL